MPHGLRIRQQLSPEGAESPRSTLGRATVERRSPDARPGVSSTQISVTLAGTYRIAPPSSSPFESQLLVQFLLPRSVLRLGLNASSIVE